MVVLHAHWSWQSVKMACEVHTEDRAFEPRGGLPTPWNNHQCKLGKAYHRSIWSTPYWKQVHPTLSIGIQSNKLHSIFERWLPSFSSNFDVITSLFYSYAIIFCSFCSPLCFCIVDPSVLPYINFCSFASPAVLTFSILLDSFVLPFYYYHIILQNIFFIL